MIFLLVVLAAQSPAADTLRRFAVELPPSALAAETRARPAAAREAVTFALARRDMLAARTLSTAYAVAWSDSFLVREVARFAASSPDRQSRKIWVDSVRHFGIIVYGRDGAMAAVSVWRRALRVALSIRDTAAIASVMGNMGAAFSTARQLDSAERYLDRARTLALSIGDVRVAANAIGTLALVREDRGDIGKAREAYGQAIALRKRIGDTRGTAADYNNLGLLAETTGDLAEARRQFDAALELNRHDGRDDVAATNLVNLAGVASLEGDFARATTLYQDALAIWRAREQWADAADALQGLGQLGLRRGDYSGARAALDEALSIYGRTGPVHSALAARRALAGALAGQGELQGALDELRRAQRLADSTGAPMGQRAAIALARADLAVQLNALAEAERLYSEAELLFRQAGEPEGTAAAQHGRGTLLVEKDDYPRAQTLLDGALRSQLASGQQRAAALTRLSLGELAAARGDTVSARRQFARASADLTRLGDRVAAAAAVGERAALEAAAGLPAAAESLYRAALAATAGRVAPEVTWRLHGGLALVRRRRGAVDEAARELRAAIADVEQPGRSLTTAERRSGFFGDKWELYGQLAATERLRGRPGAAFEASERLRAREMLEILTRGRVGPADTAADLIAREQDARRRIAELSVGLTQRVGMAGTEPLRGPDVTGIGGAAREALLREQAAYAELLVEMRERAPRHAALLSVPVVTWHDVAARLSTDAALVEYLVSDSGTTAFVVTRDTLAVVALNATGRDLRRLVQFARGTLDRQSPQLDSLWRGPLRGLYQSLIAPLEDAGLLAGKGRLVIVPQAELHYVPFAALLDGQQRFLVERYEIAETPSAAVWLALGDRRSHRAGVGVLALAPRADVLRGTAQELAAIARLTGAQVLSGSDASEATFRRDAPTRRVIHLATYGILNKPNPLFSYVELAPGGGEDGRLEVHEVFGLDLNADLVVLSACQTALGSGALADVPAGDDWVGLSRAFLSAGAAQVVATLWPVEDRATAELMSSFYERFVAGSDPTTALAAAQRALLSVPATAHPFYWAGFVSVGGSGQQPGVRRPSN